MAVKLGPTHALYPTRVPDYSFYSALQEHVKEKVSLFVCVCVCVCMCVCVCERLSLVCLLFVLVCLYAACIVWQQCSLDTPPRDADAAGRSKVLMHVLFGLS